MAEEKKDESLSSKADAAFRQAASNVIQIAKQTGTPIVVWEKGHIKEVPADQLEAATGQVEANDSNPKE